MQNIPYDLESYQKIYQRSIDSPEEFWAEVASGFLWRRKWDKVLEWNFEDPEIKWFEGAKLNITENCLDRHLAALSDHPAIIWEPNNPSETARTLTYKDLYEEVCRFSNVLIRKGFRKGDRICIYMPMVPELAIAVLACARIGAIHSVYFGGFSAQSISDRIQDAGAVGVITADGSFRGLKEIQLKPVMDEALKKCPGINSVIVLKRTGTPVEMLEERDSWWHEEMSDKESPVFNPEIMDAEDMLFILYTSGSTGKPKGVVHTCAGYMVYSSYTFLNVMQYKPSEIYFCTADIGWITGHSYLLYGPLLSGATTLMFEGVPNFPDPGRLWDIVDKHKVNILYTAPTAIRSLMAAGDQWVDASKLSTLKKLGSVGEPINVEAWDWLNEKIGNSTCPIVDTWWQTETGGMMISPIAGVTPAKPGYAMYPLPGIRPVIVNEQGVIIEGNGVSGNLCIVFPWPGMIHTTYNDHERCRQAYFTAYPGKYFTGDGCLRDDDGHYRITGRVDDVLNVSGHRIGTAELENAINMHEDVVESAVVGYPHDIKGQGIYAYVICLHEVKDKVKVSAEILDMVSSVIGSLAKPDKIQFVSALPKTRSGKIMRRILRKVAESQIENLGDTSTLLDPSVVDEIIKGRV